MRLMPNIQERLTTAISRLDNHDHVYSPSSQANPDINKLFLSERFKTRVTNAFQHTINGKSPRQVLQKVVIEDSTTVRDAGGVSELCDACPEFTKWMMVEALRILPATKYRHVSSSDAFSDCWGMEVHCWWGQTSQNFGREYGIAEWFRGLKCALVEGRGSQWICRFRIDSKATCSGYAKPVVSCNPVVLECRLKILKAT